MVDTSTSVGFRSQGKRLVLETDDTTTLQKDPGESFVRVFPHSAEPEITAVMGRVTRVASNVALEVEDYVTFSGSSVASLRYPPVGPVTISQTKFWKVSPVAAYDEGEVAIILDQEAHGIVKVEYTAYYDRYKVIHGGDSCRITNAEDETDPSYDPAFLVASAEDYEDESIQISGPPCKQTGNGSVSSAAFSDYRSPELKVEIILSPGMVPEYLLANRHPNGFTLQPQTIRIGSKTVTQFCGAKVRVYSDEKLDVESINCAVSSTPVKSGTLPVRQSLTFSGSQSTSLEYPPSGRISLDVLGGKALSLFDTFVDVELAPPGTLITEVEWKSSNTYLMHGVRKVREDEVVAVTALGQNTLPCYTFGIATYATDYQDYDVLFSYDNDFGWYIPGMVMFISSSGKSGSIQLSPPDLGGSI